MENITCGKYEMANGSVAEIYRIDARTSFCVAGGIGKHKNAVGVEIYQLKTLWDKAGVHCVDPKMNLVRRLPDA